MKLIDKRIVYDKPSSGRKVARRSRDGRSQRAHGGFIETDFAHIQGKQQEYIETNAKGGWKCMSLEYNPKMIPRAKELRKPMTKQERYLWYDFLKGYAPRFQRQKTIGSYIVDFYCHKAKLVIDLDGLQHDEEHAKAYDDARTRFLEAAGLHVIRFPNAVIDHDFESVCAAIDHEVKNTLWP